MKKVFSIALVLALAFSFVAPVATSAQTMTFTQNLTIGSRGAEVTALQDFLKAAGFFPATQASTGYFGPITRSAVSAYQASKGITPTAGYFGPITRAQVNAGGSVMPPVTSVPGCPAGALFNYMTGAACSTVTTPVTPGLTGVEGTLDTRLATTPTDNSNVRTQTDVAVYGIEFRARIAPVAVQTMDLKVVVSNNGAENPGTLINTIKIWDGSTVLATVPVNMATFIRDSNQAYYVRISGLNFVVPQDTTKVLTVSFSTNSIDNDRTVTVSGYNTASVRAVSGNGVSSFYDISSFSRQHTFKKPGSSTLTLSAAGATLRSQNFRANGQDELTNVTVASFNLKSQSGDSKLLTVNASTTASGTMPTRLALYNGSTLVKEVNVASNGDAIFNNLDTASGNMIPGNDSPVTFTVKATYPTTVANASYSSTTINSVVYETPNGTSADATGSAVTNANQYVYNQAANYTLVGTPTVNVNSNDGKTVSAVATFTFNVQALGGNVTLPTGSNFDIRFATNTAYSVAADSVSATVIPNNNIADGSTAQVTVTASIASSSMPVAGLYTAYVNSITWTAGSAAAVTQTYGLDDFKAPTAFNNVK
jgi:peptidoglycan hydrolase-like protein with peptidoglycan-binding domain